MAPAPEHTAGADAGGCQEEVFGQGQSVASGGEHQVADKSAAAVHAQQEQQREWERAGTLAKSNRELAKANRELDKALAPRPSRPPRPVPPTPAASRPWRPCEAGNAEPC
ncbi:hypothetical protein HII36_48285 [Nonomuraea sp. NN258]|uniref:hypothetical protein n=1 Tax=Nonomuraea antri TaxID=2730852 RepID=UPI00156A0F2C|nr:hypothetical protein [Nonomuraea antri]NRQ39578.1 hypothetical protein [Nonomuraea antri]